MGLGLGLGLRLVVYDEGVRLEPNKKLFKVSIRAKVGVGARVGTRDRARAWARASGV